MLLLGWSKLSESIKIIKVKSRALKVSKSWKQFLVFSILPKNERKTEKKYPEGSEDIYIFFICYFGRLENCKDCFEICWPLALNFAEGPNLNEVPNFAQAPKFK